MATLGSGRPQQQVEEGGAPPAGTAAAMHAMTLARMGGMGGWDIG